MAVLGKTVVAKGSRRSTIGRVDTEAFVRDGYLAVRGAFSERTARACRDMIWESLAGHGISRADRATWNPPLVRIACPDGEPFAEAAASAVLAAACDELIGAGRWTRRHGVGGTVPVRFPSEEYPGEVGYHIEGTWWGGSEYWTNLRSRGRGLLALFLFSDVGPHDAPTRIRVGSHIDMARHLAMAGEAGMSREDMMLDQMGADRPEALATGEPFQTVAQQPPKPSDVTNMMFIGSKEQLAAAFKEAGWSTAAALSATSKLETMRAIVEARGYKEAPVSILLLDGKPPDLVFQKQNDTFAQRHHLRIWRRPDAFQGKPVWVCAATHDIGIEFSDENRTFIHKIDSNIDRERAKVVSDLLLTGMVKSLVARPACFPAASRMTVSMVTRASCVPLFSISVRTATVAFASVTNGVVI